MSETIAVLGKSVALRRLDAGDLLDLIEAAGENAANRVWMRFATLVCSIQSIDGVPQPFPRDAAGIKVAARRMGTPMLEAVQEIMSERNDAESELVSAKN